jgi:hypothetical protein
MAHTIYEWGHLKDGKLVHRTVSPEQATILRAAIANYRKARKLMQAWEHETERLIDAETTSDSPRKCGKNYADIGPAACGK